MADEEVATKAPESDAQDSLVPGDTKAQDGPSMGVRSESDRQWSLLLTNCFRNTA